MRTQNPNRKKHAIWCAVLLGVGIWIGASFTLFPALAEYHGAQVLEESQ